MRLGSAPARRSRVPLPTPSAVRLLGDLVERLQVARRELALESALAKLDKYHLLILDDIS